MEKTMLQQCRLIKLTSTQCEELLTQGWPHAEPGAALVEISPKLAAHLLKTQHDNRPEKERNKEKILAAIRGKYFQANGETIILSETLQMLDGQTRVTLHPSL
jgi:hypothetical protein